MKKSRKNKFIRKRGGSELLSKETNPADIDDGNSESTLRDSSPESKLRHGLTDLENRARTGYTMGNLMDTFV